MKIESRGVEYAHMRAFLDGAAVTVAYLVQRMDGRDWRMSVGLSLCAPCDQFSRPMGRRIASGRLASADMGRRWGTFESLHESVPLDDSYVRRAYALAAALSLLTVSRHRPLWADDRLVLRLARHHVAPAFAEATLAQLRPGVGLHELLKANEAGEFALEDRVSTKRKLVEDCPWKGGGILWDVTAIRPLEQFVERRQRAAAEGRP